MGFARHIRHMCYASVQTRQDMCINPNSWPPSELATTPCEQVWSTKEVSYLL